MEDQPGMWSVGRTSFQKIGILTICNFEFKPAMVKTNVEPQQVVRRSLKIQ